MSLRAKTWFYFWRFQSHFYFHRKWQHIFANSFMKGMLYFASSPGWWYSYEEFLLPGLQSSNFSASTFYFFLKLFSFSLRVSSPTAGLSLPVCPFRGKYIFEDTWLSFISDLTKPHPQHSIHLETGMTQSQWRQNHICPYNIPTGQGSTVVLSLLTGIQDARKLNGVPQIIQTIWNVARNWLPGSLVPLDL